MTIQSWQSVRRYRDTLAKCTTTCLEEAQVNEQEWTSEWTNVYSLTIDSLTVCSSCYWSNYKIKSKTSKISKIWSKQMINITLACLKLHHLAADCIILHQARTFSHHLAHTEPILLVIHNPNPCKQTDTLVHTGSCSSWLVHVVHVVHLRDEICTIWIRTIIWIGCGFVSWFPLIAGLAITKSFWAHWDRAGFWILKEQAIDTRSSR